MLADVLGLLSERFPHDKRWSKVVPIIQVNNQVFYSIRSNSAELVERVENIFSLLMNKFV